MAAVALGLTAHVVFTFGIVDEILVEPVGGAHTDPAIMSKKIANSLTTHLENLDTIAIEALLDQRYLKFRNLGRCDEYQLF